METKTNGAVVNNGQGYEKLSLGFRNLQSQGRYSQSRSLVFVVGWFLLTVLLSIGVASLFCYIEIHEYQEQITVYANRLQSLEEELNLAKLARHQDGVLVEDVEGIPIPDGGVILGSLPTIEQGSYRHKRDVNQTTTMLSLRSSEDECPPGPRGPPGRDGLAGRDGRDGMPGLPGTPATPGASGPIGPRGDRGMKGDIGVVGDTGEKGNIGKSGPVGVKGDKGSCGCDSQPQPQHVTQHRTGSSNSSEPLSTGSVYVRWGRTTCPETAELVYEGLAAGSYFSHLGGSSSYECLPLDPQWDQYNDAWNSKSYIYGAEYEVASFDPFSHDNAAALHNHDVPCALCRVPTRGVKLMIPAKKECPQKWTKEYSGYLVAGNYNHNAQYKFECMDEAPEVRSGTHPNGEGAHFYVVEGNCGSLPCAPYVSGRELTCVVCTI